MIISKTPFRISFLGGGTDYPEWYKKHGGTVLAAAIDKYGYLTCRYLPPFFEHRFRIVWSKIELCQTIDEIAHPAVRETLRFLRINRGMEIHYDGDLPARSGLGSSSSFVVGLLHALYALKGVMPTKEKLARESIFIERELLKETVGCQDQILSAYGGFNQIVFSQNGEFRVRPITLSSERLEELQAHLMLFYTGLRRKASDVAQLYVNRLEEKSEDLLKMKKMVENAVSILHSKESITEFGQLLHEAWQIKRCISSSISNPMIDDVYEEARSAGAIGGKLLGAGSGGFMLFFVEPSKQKRVAKRLRKLIHVPFAFDFSGSQIIFFGREVDYSMEEQRREEALAASNRGAKQRLRSSPAHSESSEC